MPENSNNFDYQELTQYSKGFARKLSDYFFIDHTHIYGKEILDFCEIKQINLLVIKHLFETWQTETGKLESPYFDYENEEVRNALQIFMNVLSQHICISKEHFNQLLAEAVKDALLLVLSPRQFYLNELQRLASKNKKIQTDYFKEQIKYIQFNKELLKTFVQKLEKRQVKEMALAEALKIFEDTYSDYARFVEPMVWRIKSFESIFPLNVDNPFGGDTQTQQKDITTEELIEIQQISQKVQEQIESQKSEIPEQTTSNESSIVETIKDEIALNHYNGTTHKENLKYEVAEEDSRILLNDVLKNESKSTVLETFQQAHIESIRAAIPLHQKFSFINILFHGNNFAFNDAIDGIEVCKTVEQAEILVKEYASKFNWDFESQEVVDFKELVGRKFN